VPTDAVPGTFPENLWRALEMVTRRV